MLKNALQWWNNTATNATLSPQAENLRDVIQWKICIPLEINFNHPFTAELEAAFDKHIIWQADAKKHLWQIILHSILKIRDRKWPLWVLFFHGPTWVGKTEMVKALAETLFWDPNGFIRVDCENYMDSHTGSTLFWSPKWYIGYNEPTPLTNKNVMLAFDIAKQTKRLNPHIKNLPWINIVLFDEIEKAHPDVRQQLLALLDEWKITLTNNEVVNFQNSIIIFTSNLGQKDTKKLPMGFNNPTKEDKKISEEKQFKQTLKENSFSREFIGRIHHFIWFEELTEDDYKEIIDIQINWLNSYLLKYYTESNIQVKISDELYKHVIQKWHSTETWARELVRTYFKEIESKLEILLHSSEFVPYFDHPGEVIILLSYEENKIKTFLLVDDKTKKRQKKEIKLSEKKEKKESISLDVLNDIFSTMSAYVELTYLHLDWDIDMQDELRIYAWKLREFGISHSDISKLKNRAYLEGLRDLCFIDHFEWIWKDTDGYGYLFSPYEPRTIEKIVEKKLAHLYETESYPKKKFIQVGMQNSINTIIRIMKVEELSWPQVNQLLFYIRKVLSEKYWFHIDY